MLTGINVATLSLRSCDHLLGQTRNIELQDRVVGLFGTILTLVVLVTLLRRLASGRRTKTADEDAPQCEQCGYYFVASDETCPKCGVQVTRCDRS